MYNFLCIYIYIVTWPLHLQPSDTKNCEDMKGGVRNDPVFDLVLSCVWVTKTVFGLVIGFINHIQVVTTINYYTTAALHNLQSLHTNLFSLSVLVFMDL
jgi:hypothetical protein